MINIFLLQPAKKAIQMLQPLEKNEMSSEMLMDYAGFGVYKKVFGE